MNIEGILHVSADGIDGQSRNVNCDDAISLWTFKNMEFNQVIFACSDDSKLTEPHLKHHVLPPSGEFLISP